MPNGPPEAQQCLQESEHLLRARCAHLMDFTGSERSWKHCWIEKPGRANKTVFRKLCPSHVRASWQWLMAAQQQVSLW